MNLWAEQREVERFGRSKRRTEREKHSWRNTGPQRCLEAMIAMGGVPPVRGKKMRDVCEICDGQVTGRVTGR